jgi:hypothetical protein
MRTHSELGRTGLPDQRSIAFMPMPAQSRSVTNEVASQHSERLAGINLSIGEH